MRHRRGLGERLAVDELPLRHALRLAGDELLACELPSFERLACGELPSYALRLAACAPLAACGRLAYALRSFEPLGACALPSFERLVGDELLYRHALRLAGGAPLAYALRSYERLVCALRLSACVLQPSWCATQSICCGMQSICCATRWCRYGGGALLYAVRAS